MQVVLAGRDRGREKVWEGCSSGREEVVAGGRSSCADGGEGSEPAWRHLPPLGFNSPAVTTKRQAEHFTLEPAASTNRAVRNRLPNANHIKKLPPVRHWGWRNPRLPTETALAKVAVHLLSSKCAT